MIYTNTVWDKCIAVSSVASNCKNKLIKSNNALCQRSSYFRFIYIIFWLKLVFLYQRFCKRDKTNKLTREIDFFLILDNVSFFETSTNFKHFIYFCFCWYITNSDYGLKLFTIFFYIFEINIPFVNYFQYIINVDLWLCKYIGFI